MKCDIAVIMAYVAKKRSTNRLRIKPNFCISSIKPLIHNDWKLYTDNVKFPKRAPQAKALAYDKRFVEICKSIGD